MPKTAQPMTPEEITAMNAGTTPVTHTNGSKWLAWRDRRGGIRAKYIGGEMPEGQPTEKPFTTQGTPVKMDRNEFFAVFHTDQHAPELCGCEYLGDNLWNCGYYRGKK